MRRDKKTIPQFKSEDEEREFWAVHDTTDYLDWKKSKKALFPELKPSLKSVSIRLPENLIAQLKVEANKRDVPYQSLAVGVPASDGLRESNALAEHEADLRRDRLKAGLQPALLLVNGPLRALVA